MLTTYDDFEISDPRLATVTSEIFDNLGVPEKLRGSCSRHIDNVFGRLSHAPSHDAVKRSLIELGQQEISRADVPIDLYQAIWQTGWYSEISRISRTV